MKEVLNTEDQQTLKNAVEQIVNSHYRMQAEKDNIKAICDTLKEKEIIVPKTLRQLAKLAYEDSANKTNDEVTELLDLAESIGIYSHNPEGE